MMSSTSDNIFLIEEDGECPIEIVNLTPVRKRYRKTSDEDRRRIIQCARTGGDLRTLAENLGINFRTCLSVARTNREYELKRGLPRHKFTEEHKQHLCSVVDLNPEYTLKQIKEQMQKDFDGLSISISSVDRLWMVMDIQKNCSLINLRSATEMTSKKSGMILLTGLRNVVLGY